LSYGCNQKAQQNTGAFGGSQAIIQFEITLMKFEAQWRFSGGHPKSMWIGAWGILAALPRDTGF
jgi:hypothetical protein